MNSRLFRSLWIQRNLSTRLEFGKNDIEIQMIALKSEKVRGRLIWALRFELGLRRVLEPTAKSLDVSLKCKSPDPRNNQGCSIPKLEAPP